jgi:hypothetical protein
VSLIEKEEKEEKKKSINNEPKEKQKNSTLFSHLPKPKAQLFVPIATLKDL